MYVLMSDGSKIQTRFEKVGGVQDVFHDDAGRTFFRADHVRFELESPIDVAEIQNLVFTGDNSRIYEGEDRDVYKRQVLGVSPDLSTSLPMKYRTTTLDSGTLYLGSDQFSVCGNYTLKEGRDISAFDVDRRSRVCVLGSYVADSLFQYADPIGETVYFGGEPVSYTHLDVYKRQL